MRRVMVTVWGPDGNTYAGRSMTLFRDEDVKFGGMAVGGIRISHMSHITRPITMALTATRANKKPYTVQPLIEARQNAPAPKRTIADWLADLESTLEATHSTEEVNAVLDTEEVIRTEAVLKNGAKQRFEAARAAALARCQEPPPAEEYPPGDDLPAYPEDPPQDPEVTRCSDLRTRFHACMTVAEVHALAREREVKATMYRWKKERPELFKSVDDLIAERLMELEPAQAAS